MKLQLEDAYEELCAEYNTKPRPSFLACLRTTFASADGEVFLDASAVEGDHVCVFAELLRRLLRRPNLFIQPTIVQLETPSRSPAGGVRGYDDVVVPDNHVYYAVPPRLLRLKVRLSRNINNADVERICGLVAVQKTFDCVPFPVPQGDATAGPGQATGSLSQLNWPEKAAVESIDLHDCVFVSLAGGRALREAARRNVYMQNIFLEGCSVNAAVMAHVAAATRSNRAEFRIACASTY